MLFKKHTKPQFIFKNPKIWTQHKYKTYHEYIDQVTDYYFSNNASKLFLRPLSHLGLSFEVLINGEEHYVETLKK